VSTVASLLVAFLASAPVEILAVRLTGGEGRASLKVLTTAAPGDVAAQREGEEVVIVLEASALPGLSLPPPVAPVQALRLVPEPGRTSLRVKVAPEVPFELHREETLVSVVFGERTLAETVAPGELYQKLFPGAATETTEAAPRGAEEAEGEGVWLGPVRLRPALVLGYVDVDVADSETGAPVRERYLQIQPTLGASASVWGGRIRAGYEPRFRTFTTLGGLGTTTHLFDVAVDLTVAQRLELHGAHHLAHGVLETSEVDPGREYFFPLGPFDRNDTSASARFEMTARLGLEASFDWNRIDVGPPSGFSGYDEDTARAGLGYEVGPSMKASVGYERRRVLASPTRPVIEAEADSVFLRITDDRGPAVSGHLEVAYRDQRSPRAAAPGQRFRGLNYSAALRRAFGVSALVELGGGRATDVSAFEANAFYVSNAFHGGLTLALPWEMSLRSEVGWTWNRYRVPASAIGVPRADDLFGWSVGASRSFGRRVFLRADYRRDRRRSNVPGFDLVSHGFIAQLGVGLFPDKATAGAAK
jgi:hypothetical protein